MTSLTTARRRPHRRLAALVAALLLACGLASVTVPAAAAAARPAAPAQPGALAQPAVATDYRLTATPLLLLHGYGDNCHDAFGRVDDRDPGASAQTTVSYFQSHHFPDVRTIGYYGDSLGNPSDAGCDVNLQSLNAGNSHCGTARYNFTHDPLEHLSCLLAWYLSGQPQPVDIIAHSMGGLLVRAAMYFTTNPPPSADGYTFPASRLPVSRVITVATPHDGLQGVIAQLYNQEDGSPEVADMTVCHDYAPTCTISTVLDPAIGAAHLKTSAFMSAIHNAAKPSGSVDTYWVLMGSAESCGFIPYTPFIDGRTFGGCVARKSYDLDPFTSTDFVVQADSQMAAPADAKIFYGDIEFTAGPGLLNTTIYNSGATGYNHEANTCSGLYSSILPEVGGISPGDGPCTSAPFYLNDARSGTTKAWMCTTGCSGGANRAGIADLPYAGGSASASTVLYALPEMARLLLEPTRAQVGHAAHAGNDYPYPGMGLFGQDEGVDPWTQFYGQCDSFGAWKVYENLGGTGRPSATSLPAVGWAPADGSISPVLGYARLSGKAGTWGDAHDWIRSDQGLHAAPYFGVPFDSIPQPGSLAIWRSAAEDSAHGMGTFGHVAYVTDVLDADTIRIESYNLHGNGQWAVEQVTRSGGGVDTGFGTTVSFSWPAAFVHLGDGPAGGVQQLPTSGIAYPPGTYGPTTSAGGPYFTLAGAAYPNTVHGWSLARGHGVLGWLLYTNTHAGTADSTATWNPVLPAANGCYRVSAFVPNTLSNSGYALYTVTDQRFGTSVVPVDENRFTNRYTDLGVFQADPGGHLAVQLSDQGPPGLVHQVAADAVRYVAASCAAPYRSALVVDPATPGFATTSVWYTLAGHGLRGGERWTHTNGATAVSTATWTPMLPAGCYQVDAYVPDNDANAPAALYTVTDGAFSTPTLSDVDQSATTDSFVTLGVFETRVDGTIAVRLTDQNPTGLYVAADAMKFTPAACTGIGRWSAVVDPGTGSPDFSTAGTTIGNGDVHGWYRAAGHGLRGNQWWTYAGGTTASSTATYAPSGLPRAGGCFDVRVFVPDTDANNPKAGYGILVNGPNNGLGTIRDVDQSTPTNAWVDLGRYPVPAGGYITVTVNDTGPTNAGTLYTAADAIDFRITTGC